MPRYFLDSVDAPVIETWLATGVIEGVTTNPKLARAHGLRLDDADYRKLAELVAPLPLSVQCRPGTDAELLAEARRLAELNDNVIVKVPVISRSGKPLLHVIHALAQSGVRINVTACVSLVQLSLGAAAGASYVSFMLGRADDAGMDADAIGVAAVRALDRSQASLIVASIRGVRDLYRGALLGDCVITAPPAVLDQALRHPASQRVVEEFYPVVTNEAADQ